MIKEFLWYVQPDRFTTIAHEIESAVINYASIKKNNTDEKEELREKTRRLCETHLIKSGLREEEQAFINIDAEFFDGNTLNRKNLDTFIKEIIKAHCYQKVLWSYMGTTSTFTCISKLGMEADGFRYEDYLPAEYKRAEKAREETKKEKEKKIPLYAYGDGSVSETYNREKARLKFDRLSDGSGINWKRGYDPNDTVKKEGWYGTFDENGVWVKVNEKENKRENGSVNRKQIEKLQLIKTGEGAILYDSAGFLLNAAILVYLTEEGHEYAQAQADVGETVEQIRQAMKELGVKEITQVAYGSGKKETSTEEKAEAGRHYQSLLGSLAAKGLEIHTAEVWKKAEETQRVREAALEAQEKGVFVERLLGKLPGGSGAEEVREILGSGSMERPLDLTKKEDVKELGLSAEDYEAILKIKTPEEKKETFNKTLSRLIKLRQQYSENGLGVLSIKQLAEETHKQVNLGKPCSLQLSSEKTVAQLCTERAPLAGMVEEIPVGDLREAEGRKALTRKLVEEGYLSEEVGRMAEEALGEVPVQKSEEQQLKTNRAITRALYSYKEIAASTGMRVKETITEAVKASGGQLGASISAFPAGIAARGIKAAERRVYVETPLEKLIQAAGEAESIKRRVSLGEVTGGENPVLVIGGESGQRAEELLERYAQGQSGKKGKDKQKAELPEAIKKVLEHIRVSEEADETQKEETAKELEAVLGATARAEENAGKAAEALWKYLSDNPAVSYNLSNKAGAEAYVQSGRYHGSGIKKEELEELAAFASSGTEGRKKKESAYRREIKGQYKAKESVVPLRVAASGIPPVVHAVSEESIRERFLRLTERETGVEERQTRPETTAADTVAIDTASEAGQKDSVRAVPLSATESGIHKVEDAQQTVALQASGETEDSQLSASGGTQNASTEITGMLTPFEQRAVITEPDNMQSAAATQKTADIQAIADLQGIPSASGGAQNAGMGITRVPAFEQRAGATEIAGIQPAAAMQKTVDTQRVVDLQALPAAGKTGSLARSGEGQIAGDTQTSRVHIGGVSSAQQQREQPNNVPGTSKREQYSGGQAPFTETERGGRTTETQDIGEGKEERVRFDALSSAVREGGVTQTNFAGEDVPVVNLDGVRGKGKQENIPGISGGQGNLRQGGADKYDGIKEVRGESVSFEGTGVPDSYRVSSPNFDIPAAARSGSQTDHVSLPTGDFASMAGMGGSDISEMFKSPEASGSHAKPFGAVVESAHVSGYEQRADSKAAVSETAAEVLSATAVGGGNGVNTAQRGYAQSVFSGEGSTAGTNHAQPKREIAEDKKKRKMEMNYERDKAQLRREQPALARSATHDVGHAEGSGKKKLSSAERKRMNNRLMNEVKGKLKR